MYHSKEVYEYFFARTDLKVTNSNISQNQQAIFI